MSIHQKNEILVGDELAAFVDLIDSGPGERDSQGARVFLRPLLIGHLAAVGTKPENILDACTLDRTTLKEIATAEDRVSLAQGNHLANQRDEFPLRIHLVPM